MNASDRSPKADADPMLAAMSAAAIAMAALAETRDSDTGKHLLRVQHYVRTLALRLQVHPRFAAELTAPYIDTLFQLVPLYDMGTIGVPDRILLKPGRLTPAEYAIMKTHT
ncbi:MAG: metal-dependent phosphohydrolase, partial [Burkholderiaceae bacterium]